MVINIYSNAEFQTIISYKGNLIALKNYVRLYSTYILLWSNLKPILCYIHRMLLIRIAL